MQHNSDGNLCCLAEFQLFLSLPDAMEEPQVMIVTCQWFKFV